jgi:hypothetical protein
MSAATRKHLIEAHSLLTRADVDLRLAQERCLAGGMALGETFELRRAIDLAATMAKRVEEETQNLEEEPV